MDAPQPEIRVGDRERREIDERLRAALNDGVLTLTEYDERAALCWAARTRSDLDPLVSDLPNATPAPSEQPTQALATPTPSCPADGAVRKRFLNGAVGAGLLGVALVFGVPALGAADGMSLFGSREVSVLDPADSDVEVGVLFGSVHVVVPDDVRVRTAGTVVFGSLNCDEACSAGPGREVVVNGSGAFGSVNVLRQGERDREVQREIAEDRQEELEDQLEDRQEDEN